jgi:hypothetical protein
MWDPSPYAASTVPRAQLRLEGAHGTTPGLAQVSGTSGAELILIILDRG